MQVQPGQRGDYAVRAVLHLARAGGRRRARDIAAAMAIPETYLPQILGALIRKGIVASVAGPGGGYTLARPGADISLLEVVEAAEGPVRNMSCIMRGGPCHREGKPCAVHDSWAQAQEALATSLAAVSYEWLARRDTELEHRSGRT
jgi:Rrf2 family iron-sulfur cluster assembly transcriptional regulator